MTQLRTLPGTRTRTWVARLVVGAALAISPSCSQSAEPPTPVTTTASGTVGSRGGRVELVGTASLVLPPGAVDADVTLGMAIVDPPVLPPASSESKVVAVTPHGLALKRPARISLQYKSTTPVGRLSVLRLADPSATTWALVGGVRFSGGVATFETMTFSYYVVVDALCEPLRAPPCTKSCECCGTKRCVDLATSPKNCGACGNTCGADGYCNTASTCTQIPASRLCDNKRLVVVGGELPDLAIVTTEQTSDGTSAAGIASAIAGKCGLPEVTTLSQATIGALDACTDAPLQTGGTTDLVVGGPFVQRLARFFEANGLAPYRLQTDATTGGGAFVNRSGSHLVDFAGADINPKHDYFMIALIPEPERGALLLHLYGVGWEGTPAAAYYFTNVALPQIIDGTREWQHNLLVEWTDDGDGIKGAGDTFEILAKDQ